MLFNSSCWGSIPFSRKTSKRHFINLRDIRTCLAGKWASTRSALETPDVGGVDTSFDSKDLALAVVFGALYASLVIVQGQTAAATIQLRIADCLIPLCALFGSPAVAGVAAGAFAGNVFTSLPMAYGVYDVVLGPLANIVAGFTVYQLRRRRLTGCVLASLEIGLIVGSYVWVIFGAPANIFNIGFPAGWPFWLSSVVSITASSLVAIAVIGYALLSIIGRKGILSSLKSKGLKTVS